MWRRKKHKESHDAWVNAERAEAQEAVRTSEQQLETAQGLAHQSAQVNRRFRFLKQRNMFAEGFRAIIREARQ